MLSRRLAKFGTGCLLLTGVFAAVAADKTTTSSPNKGVQITELTNRLRVEINGQLFTEYYFKDVPRPFCYPLLGPDSLPMMRNWPMKDVAGEDHDHPHHRSLWFTHGSVNGIDFWSEQKDFGKIVHDGFVQVASGTDAGVIKTRNKWVAKDGTVVCTDERTLRIYNRPASERRLDFEITIHASNGDLTFGDTKEGSMAVRLNETMRLKPNKENVGKPTGHIVNSEGVKDDATWGKRAKWCDYYGPVEGKTVGIAIFDHPSNPRYPTWWHVRDYGLFAANPFGQHDFESLKDKTAGNLVVASDKSITFRYGVYMHEGDDQQAGVAARYAEYLKVAAKNSK
ncbi:MAG: PmoA family protein [Verrucomicrobia bacterium]|nr:PmoA family protein [Verrucomicrobiota bacterium]